MVSINRTTGILLLKDINLALSAKLNSIDSSSIESAFSLWIFPKSEILANLPDDFSTINYSHVAQLGYLMDIRPDVFEKHNNQLIEGLERVVGRPAVGAMTGNASFYSDAIALLGLSLGAKLAGNRISQTFHKWLKGFVNFNDERLPEWKKALIQTALWVSEPSSAFQNIYSKSIADFLLAIQSRGIQCFDELDLDDVYRSICNETVYQDSDIVFAAPRLQAIDYITNHLPTISLAHPKIDQLIALLSNITASFKRWVWEEQPKTSKSASQRWDLQNEYHVQSLLYFLLAPIFPDIESEFYLENTGSLNSRADIGLPSLNLIIEVKFLRKGKKFQKMIEEVAADSSIYFKKDSVYKHKYSKMLVFLWDNTRRDEEHALFKSGVNGLENVVGAVVLSRPGILSIPE